jgi:3-deoxy-manno-octulosonate cytidylyltransferase (CMP-KDO synthetase)
MQAKNLKQMKILGIIPARYGSTRLEGKPLVDINGKSMIRRVYENGFRSINDLYVATDDKRIVEEVIRFGGKVIMTSADHKTGTNRCLEAYELISKATGINYDVILNIQGDEPLLDPRQLEILKGLFTDEYIMMATLVCPVNNPADFENKSEAFVVFDKNKNALYFSRSVIPYLKGVDRQEWHKHHMFYKHVGMYAYTPEAFEIYASLPPSGLETTEGLEQNRWLENGYSIKLGITEHPGFCVDTPQDLEKIRKMINKLENKNSNE